MKQYAEKVNAMVSETLNKETEVMEVPKTNETLTGICIKDGPVGAVFYVNGFFEEGLSEEECAREIVKGYRLNGVPEQDLKSYDYSFDAIKDKLIVKAVNITRNQEMLNSLVYKDTGCGLAIIPAIDISENYMCNIATSLAKAEGYNIEKLFDAAFGSSAKLAPAKMFSLDSFMFDTSNLLSEEELDELDNAYVLTNEKGFCGAAAMFYEGVMEKIAELFGTGFYIIPSSIHEVILVPDNGNVDVDDLKCMVVAANETIVTLNEILSDSIYYFDGRLREVA